jgi:hypothetical protein
LHQLAQTDPRAFRAKLAALDDADLVTQATLYSLFAETIGYQVSPEETLRHFRRIAELGHAQQRSEDAVCLVLFELALTDGPALVEFLRGHGEEQRAALAWRFAAWLQREHAIVREPSHLLRGWQQLIVGSAASGLQVELADAIGYCAGWDVAVGLMESADAPATYHFTRAQLIKALDGAIEMFLEYQSQHGYGEMEARGLAADEVIQGLDADKELAADDPNERLRLQLPGVYEAADACASPFEGAADFSPSAAASCRRG